MLVGEVVPGGYLAERAVADDGSVYWAVVDDGYRLHVEACAFLAGLRAAGRAYNTERTYASRIALYLDYCLKQGVDWSAPSFGQLTAMLHWLVDEPLPAKTLKPTAKRRYRTQNTANKIMATVCDYLKWCSLHDWVPMSVVNQLSKPRYLRFLPPGFDAGENGRHRVVQERTIKFRVTVPGFLWLDDDQVETVLGHCVHARDRFLVYLLASRGLRIGEALGLRREDMHLLPDSRVLGCDHQGPHVHIRRRDNANGVFAKSPYSRAVPVDGQLIELYIDYQHERDAVAEAAECDMVFVNLFHAPLGAPMHYDSTYELFCRLAAKAGFRARPHMMRHSAATRMLRGGVDQRVVQEILGHASAASMDVYSHVTDDDLADAMEAMAEIRRKRKAGL